MKKEKIFKILFLTALFSFTVLNVYAMFNSENYSRSTSYASALGVSNINNVTVQTVNNLLDDSLEAYNACGYNSLVAVVDPQPLVVLSRATSSKVQLYFSHGDDRADRINFLTSGLIARDEFELNFGGITYYGVNALDWTDKKLVTLAACNSAGSDITESMDSIAARICQNGCEMTVGWYTKIPGVHGQGWLERYHNKLEQGSNVLEAARYANQWIMLALADANYTYKNCKVYSHGDPTPITNNVTRVESSNENLIKSFDNTSKLFNKVNLEQCMKNIDLQFDLNDYYLCESEGLYLCDIETGVEKKVEGYIDAYKKYGDYITNSAYVIVLDNEDNIKEVYDYTKEKEFDVQKLSDKEESYFKVDDIMKDEYLRKAKANHVDEKIIEESIIFQYDIVEDRRFVVVSLTLDSSEMDNYKVYEFDI